MGDENFRIKAGAEYQPGFAGTNTTSFKWNDSKSAPDYVGQGLQLHVQAEWFKDSYVAGIGLSGGYTWLETVDPNLSSHSEDFGMTQLSVMGSAHYRPLPWLGLGGGARLGGLALSGKANVGAPLAYEFGEDHVDIVAFIQPELSVKFLLGMGTIELGYQALFPFNSVEMDKLNPGDPSTSTNMGIAHGAFLRASVSFGLFELK